MRPGDLPGRSAVRKESGLLSIGHRELLLKAKRKIAGTRAWRAFQSERQVRKVERLLEEPARGEGAFTPEELARRLDVLRPLRIDLPERPSVAVFGNEDWEKHGLWPSFKRVADVHFFPLGKVAKDHGLRGPPSESQREGMCRAYLAELDAVLARQPVHLAFFYVDTGGLLPFLFHELGKRRIWSVVMGLDDKHQFIARRRHGGVRIGQELITSDVDVYWTTWRAGADVIGGRGGRPWYAPEAADPAFHHPVRVERDLDVVFVGQRYGRRGDLVEYLRGRGLRVACFGRGWETGHVDFEETVQLFSRAKVVLGMGDTGAMTGLQALKGRDFEAPMSGAVYLTSFNPELADFFHIGREILCWSSFENCLETLVWLLPRAQEQERIREAARARALRDHTWEARLIQMFELIRGKKG